MQKFSIILTIILLTAVFVYSMNVLSDNNKCTGVRVYDCEKWK